MKWTTPITIIGAGISGSAVAQCLKRYGASAPFRIYDRANKDGSNHYSIALYPYSHKTFVDYLASHSSGNNASSEHMLKELKSVCNLHSPVDLDLPVRVVRGTFEKALRTDLDVQWDHNLDKITPSASEQGLDFHFRNGQTLNSSFAIVADGEHSTVRRTLTTKSKLVVLPYVAYHSSRRISAKVFDEKYASYFDKEATISTRVNSARLQLEAVPNDSPDTTLIRSTYSRPVNGPQDPLHFPDRAPSEATNIPEAFFEEVEDLRPSLPQPYHDLLAPEALRQSRTLHWLLRKMVLDPEDMAELARQGIMLVGNAAHVEPIVGSRGANAALLDAIAVVEHLNEHGTSRLDDYYAKNHGRWEEGIRESEERLAEMHRPPAQKSTL